MIVKEVDLDLSWAGDYNAVDYDVRDPDRIRGRDSFLSVNKTDVEDINEFVKGVVLGALYVKGLKMGDVVFEPADRIKYVNTKGRPAYVFVNDDETYQIETWFHKKGY